MEMGFCKTGSTFLWQAKLSKGWSQTNNQEEKKSEALHCFLYACHLPQRTLPLIHKPTGYNWQGQ